MVVYMFQQMDAEARREAARIDAQIKAYDQEKARRDMEVVRLRTPADAAKRADEMQAKDQPRHLMNLIEDLRYKKPEVLEGITPAHVAWVAETFAKEGQNQNLVSFISGVIGNERLRRGLTPAIIDKGLGKMAPGLGATVMLEISKDPELCASISPGKIESIATRLVPAAEANHFITLLEAAENYPAWKPLIRKAAEKSHLDYAFRPADETGTGNAILLTQRFDGRAYLSVLHEGGYRSYWWSMKPQKPIALLTGPLRGKKTATEISTLRQGVASKYRGAMQELIDRHPHNMRLRDQLAKLDGRIVRLGLTAA